VNISIAGTGYVGLVTGVCLAEVGYKITCFDIDENKVQLMKDGFSPIYEPGLSELMKKNSKQNRLFFTHEPKEAYKDADIIFIAVGTPEQKDGSANLQYVESVAKAIAENVVKDTIVVTKSTVPVGTNDRIKDIIEKHKKHDVKIRIASNPEFLREGTAIYDTFNGDRIVIGAEDPYVIEILEKLYAPLNIPIISTNIRSAEMIKYAANAFLATKISFINEIANICERVGADVGDVANGIGSDQRIGHQFLRAGIGYGGSCFPKDTKALAQLANHINYDFHLLKSVIEVNNDQRVLLYEKAKELYGSLKGKKVAVLGLAFKPNTDDIREAASLLLIDALKQDEAQIAVYDPIATRHIQHIYGDTLNYMEVPEDALAQADIAFIVTEWDEIKEIPFSTYKQLMKEPVILDGRNCHDIEEAKKEEVTYLSIGREPVYYKAIESYDIENNS
jgi:UDPglucose 6-dehydrogenase